MDCPEPFPDLAIAVLIRLAYGCLCARRVMVIEEVSQSLRNAVTASRAPPESAAFNHEIEPHHRSPKRACRGRDRVRCFGMAQSPRCGTKEDIRSVLEIAPADWSALLEHADAIDFFNRPEPAPAGPSDRIFHHGRKPQPRARDK